MDKKLKIAMVAACPFPVAQGSQIYMQQMAHALAERGHQVHLVCYHFGAYHEEFNFTIHRIPHITRYSRLRSGPSLQKILLDFMLTIKLWQVVTREKIDIIHAHNYEALCAALVVRSVTGKPVIFNSHNVLSDELPTYFRSRFSKRLAQLLAYFIDTLIPRRGDFCITVSEESANFLQGKGIPPDKIKFIPPGINYPTCEAPDSNLVRTKYHLGLKHLIIYTGNLDGYQNIELLFQAIKIVASSQSEVTLLVATNSECGYYQTLAQDMGIERYLSFFTNLNFNQVQEILAASDIAVCPRTSWSGFPIKLLNYMAAGKAIVASEGSAKGITHLHNGLVVSNGDTQRFAQGILQLIGDPPLAQRLGDNAKRDAANVFNWDRRIQEIEGVYEKLMHSTT